MPKITPATELGRPAVAAYAARAGQTEAQYLERIGPPVTPAVAGAAVVELAASGAGEPAPAYLLTGAGIEPLDRTAGRVA
jgi:hypothetical protein